MRNTYDGADYELAWPRALFVREATALLANQSSTWSDRCELLLEDAFVGPAPRDDLREASSPRPYGSPSPAPPGGREFLRRLVSDAGMLREARGQRRPYWSERRSGPRDAPTSLQSTVRQFATLIDQLAGRGYFEKAFEKDCVDSPSQVDPSFVIEQAIGVPNLWPLIPDRLVQDADVFCDVVEVLHDLVARPRARQLHNFAGCGLHHDDFSLEAGRSLYRWRVNAILDNSDLGLRLADEGEDVGRLVATIDPARSELMHIMAQRDDPTDRLRHAIALYRGRHAGENDKRSAVIVLSGGLEERRKLIKAELLGKDEDDLFMVANRFGIRHQNEQQKRGYSVEFLDWIFWWYLATIELTDRLLAR